MGIAEEIAAGSAVGIAVEIVVGSAVGIAVAIVVEIVVWNGPRFTTPHHESR